MSSIAHDPSEYIKGFQQLLISDKKKIAFLFGAGTSLANKCNCSGCVPGIAELTSAIEAELSKTEKYKIALSEIRDEIGNGKFQLEALLSNLEQKNQIIGKGKLNGLDRQELIELINTVKNHIRVLTGIHEKLISKECDINNLIHCDFAEWIGRADRKYPIEIFTTNYDYLFEIGLEHKHVAFYDGFTGSFMPFFNADSVEDFCFLPNQVKLWKLHGSLGWHFDEETKKVIRKDSSHKDILIYPSTLKYSDSKKQPYISLLDRLSAFLKRDDTILITCGYSFSDEHINERIRTALNSNASTHVIALYHDVSARNGSRSYSFTIDSELANIAKANSKISVYARRHAIIGCQYGQWRLRREPDRTDTISLNSYFDEDASMGSNELNKQDKGAEVWTGEGELVLTDFAKFVAFLRAMMVDNTQHIRMSNDK